MVAPAFARRAFLGQTLAVGGLAFLPGVCPRFRADRTPAGARGAADGPGPDCQHQQGHHGGVRIAVGRAFPSESRRQGIGPAPVAGTGRFDPLFESARIAKATGQALPLGPDQIVRHMLAQPLQFDPGSRFAYSNFGYCLLGRVIERVAGTDYQCHVKRQALESLGIHRLRLGHTLADCRAPTEVRYHDDRERRAAAAVGPIGARVPLAYGAWSLEALDAGGGWLASAVDLVRFASAFDDPAACPVLQPASIATMFARPLGPAGAEAGGNYPGSGWFVWPESRHPHRAHTTVNGLLVGASSYLMRRRDGVNWAVVFNAAFAPDGTPLMLRFRDRSAAIFADLKTWPQMDHFPSLS